MSHPNFDRGIRHDRKHLHVAKGLLTLAERKRMGAGLVNEFDELLKGRDSAKCHGWASVRRGGLVNTMWVVKNDSNGYRKGAQVHSKALKEHLESRGTRFRTIRYPRSKEQREALKGMARVIQSVHHPQQYGFVPQRDCVKSAAQHANARIVYLLDIENAFDQIRHDEVRDILHDVFKVNGFKADLMAQLACGGGAHLYQGNPIAPAVFNIRALWLAERLQMLCSKHGATVTLYADDITISHPYWEYFSSGFRKAVLSIIRECGFKVNEAKCKVAAVSPQKVGHYDITGLVVDFDRLTGIPYVRPTHRRRMRKKAAFLQAAVDNGCGFSHELNSDGTPKSLEMVINGLQNWSERQARPGDYPQASLPTCTLSA